MQPIYNPGFNDKNLSESDIKTIQEMYGAARNAKSVIVLSFQTMKLGLKKQV